VQWGLDLKNAPHPEVFRAPTHCGRVVGKQEVIWFLPVSPSTGSHCDHFLQADFPGLIRTMPNWIASESMTIQESISSKVELQSELDNSRIVAGGDDAAEIAANEHLSRRRIDAAT
jgi:hypothetical protein